MVKEENKIEQTGVDKFTEDLETVQTYFENLDTALDNFETAAIAFAETDLGKNYVLHTFYRDTHSTKIKGIHAGLETEHFEVIDDALSALLVEEEGLEPIVNKLELITSETTRTEDGTAVYSTIEDYETTINAYTSAEKLLKVLRGQLKDVLSLTRDQTDESAKITTKIPTKAVKMKEYNTALKGLYKVFEGGDEVTSKLDSMIEYANEKSREYEKNRNIDIGTAFHGDANADFVKKYATFLYELSKEDGE